MASIDDLIREARTSPPKPILADLLNENEIAGLHGTQEVFKTVLAMQLAESLALGTPFLDIWQVPHARRVFFFETEMSPSSLGRRLGKMYPALAPGDWLLVDPTTRHWPRRGSIVVARQPASGLLVVKRVAARPGDWVPTRAGQLHLGPDEAWLLGDAPADSVDSREYGAVTLDRLVGRAWLRYGPVGRPLGPIGRPTVSRR